MINKIKSRTCAAFKFTSETYTYESDIRFKSELHLSKKHNMDVSEQNK